VHAGQRHGGASQGCAAPDDKEETLMSDDRINRIAASQGFQELVTKRNRLTWQLTAVMLVIYFAFVLIVAFAPGVLAIPLGTGVTTIGIPVGILIILAAFGLTGFYVRKANREFDEISDKIVRETEA
jgi:uncharacterized membrane protein (DUF485 family)